MSDRFEHRFGAFLSALLRKTEAGEISWHETASEDAFRVALGNGLVRVSYYRVPRGQDRWHAVLLDREGRILEEESAYEEQADENDFAGNRLRRLFEAARRSALNIDEMLTSMEQDLNEGRTRDLPPDEEKDDDIPF